MNDVTYPWKLLERWAIAWFTELTTVPRHPLFVESNPKRQVLPFAWRYGEKRSVVPQETPVAFPVLVEAANTLALCVRAADYERNAEYPYR